jgi:flagellar basal body L-ring protein FlgH
VAALERARRAREKLEADARERTELERTRKDAEDVQQRADAERQRAAQEAVPVAPLPAQTATRTVRQICSTRENIISEQICRIRECRKPQHVGDAICVRLKELESAQQPSSQH